jgi:hypothetical protein
LPSSPDDSQTRLSVTVDSTVTRNVGEDKLRPSPPSSYNPERNAASRAKDDNHHALDKEELEDDLAAVRRPLRKVGKVPELVFGRASSTEWMKRRRQSCCPTVACGKVVQPLCFTRRLRNGPGICHPIGGKSRPAHLRRPLTARVKPL